MNHDSIAIMGLEPSFRGLLEKTLRLDGYDVTAANGDHDALCSVCRANPRVVLIDGVPTLRRLRSGGYEGMVIILAAHGDLSCAREAMRLRAYDFMVKPIRVELLKTVLDEALTETTVSGRRAQCGG